MDDRSFSDRLSRLERPGSIKEIPRLASASKTTFEPLSRRWSSRDSLYNIQSDAASGAASSSSKIASKGWADHVNHVQDEAKAKMTSAKALIYGELEQD